MKDNGVFCILPFVHLHINTQGNVKPCCIAPTISENVGKVSDSTIEEIFNSDKMKQLRLDMINGVSRPDFCNSCYRNEKAGFETYRKSMNEAFSDSVEPLLNSIQEDGYLEPKLKYLDTRYSNLCNLKCRTCGDKYSTTWSKEHADMGLTDYKELKAYKGNDPLENQYVNVERVYFAGGEPLIMPEHYETLRKIIETGRASEVELAYNTNMTKLNYNKQYLPDLWKQFKLVQLGLSIDNVGERANYIRHGNVKWNKIEQNIKTLREYSNIDFTLSPTISMMSAYTVTDMHRYLVENNIIRNIDQIRFNLLHEPSYYSVKILPDSIKKEIQAKIADHIIWIEENNGSQKTINEFQTLSEYLNETWTDFKQKAWTPHFIKTTTTYDTVRNESFPDTFPEYREWWEEITKNTIPVVNIAAEQQQSV
jgi:MoaA/NifB/PqqE/SkfB family radical SAM enzyme